MNHKRIAKYSAIFAAILVLVALAPAYAPYSGPPLPRFPPFSKAYPAQINVTGQLALTNLSGSTFDVAIDASFRSMVPSIIAPGEYDNVEFHGLAVATHGVGDKPSVLIFDGLFIVNKIIFFAAFSVQKPDSLSEGRYFANGELDLTVVEINLEPAEITMVMMKGNVTEFGEQDAFGFLEAHAKIGINSFTRVHTAFTLQPPPRNDVANNYTKSFYIVSLANATRTELDFEGNALYVEGLWNVYNRTITVTHFDHDGSIVINMHTVLEEAPGKFNVTLTPQTSANMVEGRWKARGSFTLDIEGLDMIKGDVIFYQAKFIRPFENEIPRSDFNQDHIVNILDINQVARTFGTKLGMSKYDPDADANADFVININDLLVAAQQFNQEY